MEVNITFVDVASLRRDPSSPGGSKAFCLFPPLCTTGVWHEFTWGLCGDKDGFYFPFPSAFPFFLQWTASIAHFLQ